MSLKITTVDELVLAVLDIAASMNMIVLVNKYGRNPRYRRLQKYQQQEIWRRHATRLLAHRQLAAPSPQPPQEEGEENP